jgi:hypothetical protein
MERISSDGGGGGGGGTIPQRLIYVSVTNTNNYWHIMHTNGIYK